ncbi:class I adenylate-forming enzyme family protein [soil metagenome]
MSLKHEYPLLCPDVIAHNARAHPHALAVVCGAERLSWRDLEERTNKVANALLGLGLKHQDKIALLIPASLEAFIAFWASAKAGFVVVPLNVMLDQDSLQRLTSDSDAIVIITDGDTEAAVDLIRDELPAIAADHFLTFGDGRPGWQSIRALSERASPQNPGVPISPDDVITILYTSGTTGQPKGIEHTHASRMMYPYGFSMGLQIDRYSVAILGTPPYASGTWITMMPAMYRGAVCVILKKFTAQSFLEAVEQEHGTHAFLVPTQYIALLQEPDLGKYDLSSMRCLVTSGQPIAEKTYLAIEAAFPSASIYEVYGFTEGLATLRIPLDSARGKRTSVGKPILLEDVRIVGEDDKEVAVGETGEIVAHTIGMMNGYYKNPELTAAATWVAPDSRSFIRTGDSGHLDEDGFLYVSGRLKDMIKSGGINIYANDIEQVFMRHPAVREVAAIGVPDLKWGETPLIVVILNEDTTATEDELKTWGNDILAKYQRVSRVVIREDLPRAVYGKVAKAELRQEFGTGTPLETAGASA